MFKNIKCSAFGGREYFKDVIRIVPFIKLIKVGAIGESGDALAVRVEIHVYGGGLWGGVLINNQKYCIKY